MKLASLLLAGLVALTSLFSVAPAKAQETTSRLYLPVVVLDSIIESSPPPTLLSGGEGVYLEGSPAPHIDGPAIVEWWGGNAQAPCGVAVVTTGDTFFWPYSGHWWGFLSQTALEAKYSEHVTAFMNRAGNELCVASWPIAQN